MEAYNKKAYVQDVQWLYSEGVCTSEVYSMIIEIVKRSSIMTKKELLEFLEQVE